MDGWWCRWSTRDARSRQTTHSGARHPLLYGWNATAYHPTGVDVLESRLPHPPSPSLATAETTEWISTVCARTRTTAGTPAYTLRHCNVAGRDTHAWHTNTTNTHRHTQTNNSKSLHASVVDVPPLPRNLRPIISIDGRPELLETDDEDDDIRTFLAHRTDRANCDIGTYHNRRVSRHHQRPRTLETNHVSRSPRLYAPIMHATLSASFRRLWTQV